MANLLSFEDVAREGKDGESYIAIGDNGREYEAIYSAKFNTMFFAIPSTIKVLGYRK